MAHTITYKHYHRPAAAAGGLRSAFATITGDSSYATGGYAEDFGELTSHTVHGFAQLQSNTNHSVRWVNGKLLFSDSTGAEVSAATDLTGTTVVGVVYFAKL